MLNFWPDIPWPRLRPDLPEEDPPSLRVAPEPQLGIWPGAFGLAVSDYAPNANPNADFDDTFRPASSNASPFDFANGQRVPAIPSIGDRGLLLPRSTPLLFPNTPELGLLGQGLRSLVGGPQSTPFARGSGPDDADATPSVANPSTDPIFSAGVVHSETSPVYDPAYFSQPPQDRAQEAPDQKSYAGIGNKPITAFDWLNFSSALTPIKARVGGDNHPAIGGTFDPQFIVPVQAPPPMRPPINVPRPSPAPQPPPQRPQPPGIGHNKAPARDPLPPSRSAIPPQSAPGGPAPRPPSGIEPPPNAAGPAAAAEQQLDSPRPVHPLPRTAEVWDKIVKEINEDAPGDQYEGPDGIATAVGVRLNPRLPVPTAGLDYDPVHPHLRRGHIGELQLANRIVGALGDEIVVAHGMSAGRNGPDVISVSPDGDISVWDSKWRGRPRSIGEGAAAHQSRGSLRTALKQVRDQITEAVESGASLLRLRRKLWQTLRQGTSSSTPLELATPTAVL